MATNFSFLESNWPKLLDDAQQVEVNVMASPRTAVFYSRRVLERAVLWMFEHDSYLQMPYQKNLSAMIHEPTFTETLSPGLFHQIRLIQKSGNLAVHSNSKVTQYEALQVTRSLYTFLGWMARMYSSSPPEIAEFNEAILSRPVSTEQVEQTLAQLQQLQAELVTEDEKAASSAEKLQVSEEEITRLRGKIAEIKAANAKVLEDVDYTEAETRTLFIDLMLKEAGWDPAGLNVAEYPVVGMPNDSGEGFVDYVLWGKDNLPLGLVEAKRTTKDARIGQRQAELYADCLEQMTGQRPVIFYTNGYESWIWDDTDYPSRPVQGFYTQDELQLLVNRRESKTDITRANVNEDITNRYYQKEAIQRTAERFANDKSRAALLVMATGSGKTRVSISIVDVLMRCNWAKRILFLADRTALVRQAKRAFASSLQHVSGTNLLDEKEDLSSRVVFSTYPTMMNSIDDSRGDGAKRFGVGHFDLIIIDEAHRSVYQKYRAIFEYFDGLLLGLTATPKAEVDHNTYHLFQLEDHVPTYAYELEQAVSDKFLVPPRAVKVPMKFHRQGVRYDELSEEEQAEYEIKLYDEETGTVPDSVDGAALNKWLFNKDTVNKVLKHLMEHGLKIEGGDKLGKTIIFAKNHAHALFIEEQFNLNYPHLKGKFLRVIDHYETYSQSLIDDFSIGKKDPFIAVSVDMLDTGIDVPEVVNLVFFKILRSKTKFWQMIGRGTRLCPDLFGPGKDKELFCIFDFCDNFDFFGANPEGYEGRIQESIKQRIFRRRLAIAEVLQKSKADVRPHLHESLLDAMHDEVARMNKDNFIIRPHLRYVEKFNDRPRWNSLSTGDIADIMEHLTHLPVEDNDDEFARRFDLLCLNMQLSMLEGSAMQERCMEKIKLLASGLEEKLAVPSVAAQMELILELQRDEYWQDVTLDMLDRVRFRLRNLIKFVDRLGYQKKVYTDFEDAMLEAGEGEIVDDLVKGDEQLGNYRLKVERYVRENQGHETIRRLKANEIITKYDIAQLEDLLFGENGACSRENYLETYGEDEPLGIFIRRIVGLDRSAAKKVFSKHLESGRLNADQMTFVNMVIDHLTENGVIEPSVLFSPPFTDLHHQGLTGIMPGQMAHEIMETLQQVNDNATAA